MKKNKTKLLEDPHHIDKQVINHICKTSPKALLCEEIEIAHEYLDELSLPRKNKDGIYLDIPGRIKMLIKSK